jgi:hypothetical protein
MSRKRPEPKRTAILNVRLEPDLKQKLEEEAIKQERPVSYLVEAFIRYGLGCWKPPAPTIINNQ